MLGVRERIGVEIILPSILVTGSVHAFRGIPVARNARRRRKTCQKDPGSEPEALDAQNSKRSCSRSGS
jgi:hypothetical protein